MSKVLGKKPIAAPGKSPTPPPAKKAKQPLTKSVSKGLLGTPSKAPAPPTKAGIKRPIPGPQGKAPLTKVPVGVAGATVKAPSPAKTLAPPSPTGIKKPTTERQAKAPVKGVGIKKPEPIGGAVINPPAKGKMGVSKVTQSPFSPKKATGSGPPSKAPSKRTPSKKGASPKITQKAAVEKSSGGITGVLMLIFDLLFFGATITFAVLTYMEISIFK